MIRNNEPYLIEFNVRMGDPECQVILPRLKSDFLKVIIYAVNNNLDKINIDWKKESMTIVLCSKGYPGVYKKIEIKNLDRLNLDKKSFVFHAGTKIIKDRLVANGGEFLI